MDIPSHDEQHTLSGSLKAPVMAVMIRFSAMAPDVSRAG